MQLQDCVMTALEKKTVILVTHQVEFLSEVDKILVTRLNFELLLMYLDMYQLSNTLPEQYGFLFPRL